MRWWLRQLSTPLRTLGADVAVDEYDPIVSVKLDDPIHRQQWRKPRAITDLAGASNDWGGNPTASTLPRRRPHNGQCLCARHAEVHSGRGVLQPIMAHVCAIKKSGKGSEYQERREKAAL